MSKIVAVAAKVLPPERRRVRPPNPCGNSRQNAFFGCGESNVPMTSDFFACDFFTLFNLPQTAEIDGELLQQKYRQLQTAAHPDRFADGGDSEKQAAMQMAGRINDGFAILQNPLLRAAYILELRGISAFAEDNTAMPPEFLMRQIEWREDLENASPDARKSLLNEIAAERDSARTETAAALQKNDNAAALDSVRRWKYLEKILAEHTSP